MKTDEKLKHGNNTKYSTFGALKYARAICPSCGSPLKPARFGFQLADGYGFCEHDGKIVLYKIEVRNL